VRFRALLAILLTGSSASAGHLVAVRAVAGSEATIVQLDADAPPSFTTMKLVSPPRVVIDLADTSAPNVAAQQEVGDPAVRRIAVADAGARTTRVVIELVADAEFDVRASESRVEVKIPRPAVLAAVVQTPKGDAPKALVPATSVDAAGESPPKALVPATSVDAAGASPSKALVPATTVDAAGESPPKADAENTAQPAHAPPAKVIPEIEERAALPTVALVGSPAPASGPVDRPLMPAVPRPAPRPHPAGKAAITGIGFRPQSGGEVIVRSDRPVEYEVSSAESAVLIHLRSARIPLQNNRRPLDTQFFEGLIQRIVPLEVPSGTDIRIELRQRAEVHLEQSGPLLTVSFTPRS
jgi:hypothetical protein